MTPIKVTLNEEQKQVLEGWVRKGKTEPAATRTVSPTGQGLFSGPLSAVPAKLLPHKSG